MRQWLVDPKILCNRHLLGEHVECHMFVGTFRKNKSISGYIKNNCLEPLSISRRHDELVEEIKNRGFVHKSSLPEYSISYLPEKEINHIICRDSSLIDLITRCSNCRERLRRL